MYQLNEIPEYRLVWSSIWSKTRPKSEIGNLPHGFTVCEEWREVSDFKPWFEANKIEGYELACDIYDKDNKHYSPDTALFVPPQLASLLRNRCAGFPIGVWKHGNHHHATYWFGQRHSLGCFVDEPSALKAYRLHELNRYRGKIADELYVHIEKQITLGIR